MTTNRTTVEDLRTTLVDQLIHEGVLTDSAWREVFATVHRGIFVPYFFLPCRGRPGWRLIEGDDEWRHGVYVDEALVIQLNGDDNAAQAARWGQTVEGVPTSSSSAPGLMAAMLHSLEVTQGMTVLEVGTGSGYNAALLAARLSDKAVTSIELDPALAQRARIALTTAGYRPTVVAGDGAAGYSPNARYDRVIATVALPRVPVAYLEQTHPGSLILIPLSFAGRGGLMALLRRDQAGAASGAFLAQYGGFMAVRSVTEPATPKIRPQLLDAAYPTQVPPDALTDIHPAAFYLSLCCPYRYRTVGFTPDDNSTGLQTWGQATDGSTFGLTTIDGTTYVAADGPLWDTLETAYAQWRALGQPSRDRFGVTANPARQWVWLDHPDHVITELGEL
ncbi:MAG: methyltransferase domain-containing protein [Pseudonocardiales bacterium]|nr:methyltransferase domain-containing protein [Pseudonocardiales bacterium]MBV9728583.1 methyltransferase domain-containing protein [Pseudonocardiales bacterium]